MAAMQAQAANTAAKRWAARLARKAKTNPKKLAAADKQYEEGDIATAALIYGRLAASRPRGQYSIQAQQRLRKIQDDARSELAQIDKTLQQPSQPSSKNSAIRPAETAEIRNERIAAEKQAEKQYVLDAFQQYAKLQQSYGRVPVVGKEIRKHIYRQKKRPEFAVVLNEVEAEHLWSLGQQHEQDGQLCCAYQVYQQAAELSPAPTARLAERRVELLSADEGILESVKTCNDLQWCHDKFGVAELFARVNPKKAKEVYSKIIVKAPKDSKVYVAALDRLGKSGR